jgi:ABC-type polysaccharide/polyol phosphate transport system ATPase subunit
MPTLEQIPEEIIEASQPTPEPAWLVDVQGVRKKYCRDLRRSLWYGIQDVVSALTMRVPPPDRLRESEFWAVDNISFQLRRGDALGLLGRNGAGKSTLLKLITGQRSLTAGKVATRGRMVALTELGLGFNLALTGRENAYVNAAVHGLTRAQCDAIIEDIIDFSGIREFIDSAVQTYSSGMRARLGFSVATHLKPDILVVDEVLAVGDLDFKRKCIRHILKYLREGGSVILVAHDPYLVQSMCNRCIVMERGKVIFQGSGVEGVNFHFQLGHSKQYASLLDAAERVLGDTVAEAEAEAAQDTTGRRRSPVALTSERPIVLDDIEVASVDGGPIHTGRPLKVMLHYRSIVDADVTCGFSIRSSDMQTSIASFPKGLDGDCSHVQKGEGSIVAVLPDLPLQPGVYAVRAGIGDAESLSGITIKGYEDAPHFFTVVAHDVSRSANYKVIHGDLITCKVEWIS